MTPARTALNHDDDLGAMPKAELHAHLNGSVPLKVIHQLGGRDEDYVAPTPVDSLGDYFRPWALARRLASSRENLTTLVDGVAKAFVDDGVRYAELRNSVRHLAALNDIHWSESIEWLLQSFDEASHREAIDLRLIVTLTREGFDSQLAHRMLDACRPFVGHERLVGLDLAGDETIPLSDDAPAIFRRAADELGLGITIHAGEVSGLSPNIPWAVERCHASRVGHAIAATEDERVLEFLQSSGACVEVCLTSNRLTSSVPDLQNHPVRTFLEWGVEFVLCTDNPGVHDRYLSQEYATFVELIGSSRPLYAMYERQMDHSFSHRS